MADDYENFKREVFALTKIDLNAYKEKQMKRRIDTLIAKHKIIGYHSFVETIRVNKELFEIFITYLTINVSEFYRNQEQWKILDKEVFPELIKKFGKSLTIWSAACSTGDEPYSLVMALSNHLPLSSIRIIATDLDKQIIAKAKVGLYDEKSIAAVPPDLKQKYFTKIGNSYQIDDKIKARVEFRQHDLLKDKYIMGSHLIVCRNVLIYFTEDAKNSVFMKFNSALAKTGILFIGSTEQMITFKDFGYERRNSFFYTKA